MPLCVTSNIPQKPLLLDAWQVAGANFHFFIGDEVQGGAAVCQPISAARAWSMSFCSVSACFFSVIAPTMGSPTILPLRSTT